MGIEITDYVYKDVIAKGAGKHKKVIAQQVEKVYPQVVSRSTNAIPDIYARATTADGWVSLATDLEVGDRVRLIAGGVSAIEEVLEVREGAFRTTFETEENEVFVYGREVDDFLAVDYDGIAMLNVSATQELHRIIQEKDERIVVAESRLAAMQTQLAAMEAKAAARDAQLAAIVKQLGETTTEPASLDVAAAE